MGAVHLKGLGAEGEMEVAFLLTPFFSPPQWLGVGDCPPTQASGTLLSAGEVTNEDTLTTRTEEQQRAGEAHVLL